MALYVGTNYHPHDWTKERWKTDIELMKNAGFTTVRLGHLCWDSYEPEDGIYTFEWFDEVMDAFEMAGIGVFLDVSMRPAPVWVHEKCPDCNIHTRSGLWQASLRRYMEDVDEPQYQKYALRFASVLAERYKDHHALIGFGLCNELGAGYVSFSESARRCFIQWLEEKYSTIDNLNRAWATQRWSRRLRSFEDIYLPENEIEVGAPEAWLDMKRFYSDGVLRFITKLHDTVGAIAPEIPTSMNHVAESLTPGFDYMKGCRNFVDHPGIGFYPGINPDSDKELVRFLMLMTHRQAECEKPMWCLEFQTGTFGGYAGPDGLIRMYAFLCLIYRTQMVLAWTWRSMLNGEEQYFYGLLDHDGTAGKKYREFARIASDFKKLERYHLPYLPRPEAAIAYSYDTTAVFAYAKDNYKTPYEKQVQEAFEIFYKRNLDCNLINLEYAEGDYRLLVIPACALIGRKGADYVRRHVEKGGIVIMTGYSAKVNEEGQVFDTPQPGFLNDVFGIRIAGFYRTGQHVPSMFEEDRSAAGYGSREELTIANADGSVSVTVDYYEEIEPQGAECFASFEKKGLCAVSKNQYGKGTAYYLATEANAQALSWIYDQLAKEGQTAAGICMPAGVVVRSLSEGENFYVNTTSDTIRIPLEKKGYGVLSERRWEKELVLDAFDGELLVETE